MYSNILQRTGIGVTDTAQEHMYWIQQILRNFTNSVATVTVPVCLFATDESDKAVACVEQRTGFTTELSAGPGKRECSKWYQLLRCPNKVVLVLARSEVFPFMLKLVSEVVEDQDAQW